MSYELQDFDRQVRQRSHEVPVVVDFWAPWCGPCKMLGPVLEKLAAEAGGRWDLVKVNTEDHPQLAAEFAIGSIPAVKCFHRGEVVDEFVGVQPEAQIRSWIDQHVGDTGPSDLEHAAELIDDGKLDEARAQLEAVLAATPARHAARILLAEILLASDPAAAAAALEQIPADADESAHARALQILARIAQRTAGEFPDAPLQPRLAQALLAIRRRDWDTTLDAFLDLLEQRRHPAASLATEAGKAVFRYLGIRHPIAEKYYRRFSSLLNS